MQFFSYASSSPANPVSHKGPVRKRTNKYAKSLFKETLGAAQETRQQIRARMRNIAFAEISAAFPGEPRKLRRKMAIDRSHNDYRSLRAQAE